jgi:hypothetical protein
VAALLDRLAAGGMTVGVNRLQALVSRMFTVALDRGYVDAHPAARMLKRFAEAPRERVLSDDKLRASGQVWIRAPAPRPTRSGSGCSPASGVRPVARTACAILLDRPRFCGASSVRLSGQRWLASASLASVCAAISGGPAQERFVMTFSRNCGTQPRLQTFLIVVCAAFPVAAHGRAGHHPSEPLPRLTRSPFASRDQTVRDGAHSLSLSVSRPGGPSGRNPRK